jgi:hypothetical protein
VAVEGVGCQEIRLVGLDNPRRRVTGNKTNHGGRAVAATMGR